MAKILLTLPVYNEEKVLADSVNKLYNFFSQNIKEDWEILIANNASTDKTKDIADQLTQELPKVRALHLNVKGRGIALYEAWTTNTADIYAYCDIDLATDINHFIDLFQAILAENYNIAVGTRYAKTSQTKRSIARFFISRGYIYMIKVIFNTKVHDFQCGFKAIDQKTAKEILPLIKDRQWFFDTELILVAESKGFKIKEIPVKWQEQRETKVKFIKTMKDYTLNLIKLRRRIKKL